ncbi:AI-2E family transporter [Lentzea tibetensis]|uniref:AI-2E family transporter n=1 Tax=Lentzea tibetensis TaxID=2591470 RepID=A0A563ESH4_9PSEU|nr:AI-2E family transporter [Lentzea tibetensis]
MRMHRKGLPAVESSAPDGGNRLLTILVGAAAAVITVAGLKAIAFLVAPVFLALVIVVTTSPVQGWLRRKGWPRWLTGAVLVVVVYAVLLGLFVVLVVSVAQLATLLPGYVAKADDMIVQVTAMLAQFGVGEEQLRDVAGSLDFGKIAGLAGTLLASVGGLLTDLVFLLALLLFLSTEATWAEQRFAAISAEKPWITTGLRRFAAGTRSYMWVTTVFGLIVAVLDVGALVIIGVPAAVLWGLLAFVTNYIPNIGFVIGVVPPALLALLDGGWQTAVIVVVVYTALNFVVQSVIQPKFVADSVGLSTVVTVLALVFWSWVLGPLGAILAVPATLLLKAVFVDVDPRSRWVGALINSPSVALAPAVEEHPVEEHPEDEPRGAQDVS